MKSFDFSESARVALHSFFDGESIYIAVIIFALVDIVSSYYVLGETLCN